MAPSRSLASAALDGGERGRIARLENGLGGGAALVRVGRAQGERSERSLDGAADAVVDAHRLHAGGHRVERRARARIEDLVVRRLDEHGLVVGAKEQPPGAERREDRGRALGATVGHRPGARFHIGVAAARELAQGGVDLGRESRRAEAQGEREGEREGGPENADGHEHGHVPITGLTQAASRLRRARGDDDADGKRRAEARGPCAASASWGKGGFRNPGRRTCWFWC